MPKKVVPTGTHPNYSEIQWGPRAFGWSEGSGRAENPGARKRATDEAEALHWWAWLAGARPAGSQGVTAATTPQRLGGVRTWLVCPQCDRRASSLYRPRPQAAWLCRRCHGLCYRSQREHRRGESVARVTSAIAAELVRTGGDWRGVLAMLDRAKSQGEVVAVCRALVRWDANL